MMRKVRSNLSGQVGPRLSTQDAFHSNVLLRLLAAEACRDVPVIPLAEHVVNLAGVSAEKRQVEWPAKQKRTSRCTYDRLGVVSTNYSPSLRIVREAFPMLANGDWQTARRLQNRSQRVHLAFKSTANYSQCSEVDDCHSSIPVANRFGRWVNFLRGSGLSGLALSVEEFSHLG